VPELRGVLPADGGRRGVAEADCSRQMAYLSRFAWSFLAATVLPLGSEPALVFLVRRGYSIPWLLVIATTGNYLGACTTYWLARAAMQWLSPSEWTIAGKAARYAVVTWAAGAHLMRSR
jgi:membrane protein DedA with SNARE-associated domain